MVAKQESLYLLFGESEVKWGWTKSELFKFCRLWREGVSIQEIAKALGTNKRSIAMVVMDQAEQGYIQQRERGLEGGAEIE